MAKKVVIVESPAKSRTISKYLGKDFVVVASMGHIIDLPENELAVDVERGFKPRYIIIPGKKKILDRIKKVVLDAEAVYLASDPDREGEAIAYHIAHTLGLEDKAFRVLFNEITKRAVVEGIKNPGKIDMNKVYAQQARRILDRLVGYKVSPLLWRIMKKGLSAGRVQSVALKILAKREKEIAEFVPKEFWTIDLILEKDGSQFGARVKLFRGKKLEIPNESEAKKHAEAIRKTDELIVKSVERKRGRRNPLPPFVTSTLQLEAFRKLGFSTKKTMQLAQQLYEGVELGDEGPTGLITYMRTDSVRVADIARAAARKFIKENFGEEYVGFGKFKSPKGAQEAHEAIRPTMPSRTPQSVKPYLTKDQYRLYELIWRRFIASQMAPAELERINVKISCGEYEAETKAVKVLFDGFLRVWKVKLAESEDEREDKLPELEESDPVRLVDVKPAQHFTKPPPRFTEGTLVKELESQGIGRPSTYAQIVSTLLERKYVVSRKRKLHVTELGMAVNELLQKMFPDVFEEKFTARMEEELDKVEVGDKSWQQVLEEFYEPFAKKLEQASRNRKELKDSLIKTLNRKCPVCGAPLVVRWGRFGQFIACSNYPECKYTEPLDKAENQRKEPITLDEKCPECGAPLVIRYNRSGGRFIACSNYPKCKYTRSLTLEFPCPKPDCDGFLVERTSKRGKIFYSCSNESCDFVAFDEPTGEPCPKCGAKTTFIKHNKKGDIRYCAICGWKSKINQKTNKE